MGETSSECIKRIEKAVGIKCREMPLYFEGDIDAALLLPVAEPVMQKFTAGAGCYPIKFIFTAAWVFFHLNNTIRCAELLDTLLNNIYQLTLPQLKWVGKVQAQVYRQARSALDKDMPRLEKQYQAILAERPVVVSMLNPYVQALIRESQLNSGMYGLFYRGVGVGKLAPHTGNNWKGVKGADSEGFRNGGRKGAG